MRATGRCLATRGKSKPLTECALAIGGIEQFSDRRSHEFSVVHSAGCGLAGGRSGQITWGLRDSSSDFSSFHPDEFCADPMYEAKDARPNGANTTSSSRPFLQATNSLRFCSNHSRLECSGYPLASSRRQPKVGK
jgi:hypothetical protein